MGGGAAGGHGVAEAVDGRLCQAGVRGGARQEDRDGRARPGGAGEAAAAGAADLPAAVRSPGDTMTVLAAFSSQRCILTVLELRHLHLHW